MQTWLHWTRKHALLAQKDPNGCLRFDLESCNLMCTYTACSYQPMWHSAARSGLPNVLCIYTSIFTGLVTWMSKLGWSVNYSSWLIAERSSARLWMRDLFLQCTYVSVTLRNVNLRSRASIGTHASRALTHEDTGCLSLAMEDREESRFLTCNRGRVGQRGWSSATYVFFGVEYWTQPTVGGIEKKKVAKSMYIRS